MTNQNYWTLKDSELQLLLEQYGIELEEYKRNDAVAAIKEHEEKLVTHGLEETKEYIDQLKEEQPTLKLVKVIFHSGGEQDIPYVFVGHNGKAFYIPKEQEVEVPKYILDSCIKDAVEDRMMPQILINGEVKWLVRKVQRYPYSIID